MSSEINPILVDLAQEAQHWALESSIKKSTKVIRMIVERHGPLKVNECWDFAQTTSVKSKQHMKALLRFLKEKILVLVARELVGLLLRY